MLVEAFKMEVRNRVKKLVAYDLIISMNSYKLKSIVAGLLQAYGVRDDLDSVPYIIKVRHTDIIHEYNESLRAIKLLNTKGIIIQIDSDELKESLCMNFIMELRRMNYNVCINVTGGNIYGYETDILGLATHVRIKYDLVYGLDNKNKNTMKDSLRTAGIKLILDNIYSPEIYKGAFYFGCDWITGDYISGKERANIDILDKFSKLNIIELIQVSIYDVDVMETVIGRDALMSIQLINLANSKLFNKSGNVKTIREAIERIGVENVKNWVSLLDISANSNVSEELEELAFFRALFCSKLVEISDRNLDIDKQYGYLIGLLSGVGSMTGTSIEYEIGNIRADKILSEALIFREGDGGDLYNLAKSYEDGDTERAKRYSDKLSINFKKVEKCYYESLRLAADTWSRIRKLKNDGFNV